MIHFTSKNLVEDKVFTLQSADCQLFFVKTPWALVQIQLTYSFGTLYHGGISIHEKEEILAVQEISSKEELTQLLDKIKGNKLVVVDFHADWCGPCKQLSPIMEKLGKGAEQRYEIYKIDVDNEVFRDFVSQHFVMSIPTVIFFKNDKTVDQVVGVCEEGVIKEIISKHA